MKLLVVDDEPTLRMGFAYALSNDRRLAETASNGREALAKLQEKEFDLLLVDLRMPDIDGLGVVKHLRKDGRMIPVILCSAFITIERALQAIRLGVVDFLMKPVKPADLREAVDTVLAPPETPLARALEAGRRCRMDAAAKALEPLAAPDPREAAWLKIFQVLSRMKADEEALQRLPERLLDQIAFRGEDAA